MAWDDEKQVAPGTEDGELTPDEWNEHVADQKGHSGRHESGGIDELTVEGLSGDLADEQDAKPHAETHEGGSDSLNVFNLTGDLVGEGLERVNDTLQVLSSIWDGTNVVADVNNTNTTTQALEAEEVLSPEVPRIVEEFSESGTPDFHLPNANRIEIHIDRIDHGSTGDNFLDMKFSQDDGDTYEDDSDYNWVFTQRTSTGDEIGDESGSDDWVRLMDIGNRDGSNEDRGVTITILRPRNRKAGAYWVGNSHAPTAILTGSFSSTSDSFDQTAVKFSRNQGGSVTIAGRIITYGGDI